MKRFVAIIILLSVLMGTAHLSFAQDGPKNVIFMVMDGTNSDTLTLARLYKNKPLVLDQILTGGVQTYSLQSAITDSAAAGTAMATGQKSVVDYIGMVPFRDRDGHIRARPVANILEAAKEKGLAAGIVATAPVQHATPAAFSSHTTSRHRLEEIAQQQAHQNIDVLLGGGRVFLTRNETNPLGIIQTKEELLRAQGTSLTGLFAHEDMAYEFDRLKLHPEQPSLAEMTRKAIHTLANQQKGFFLFVEGSKVDFAAHKNDPVGMISEVLAFDAAVEEALNFAKQNGQTLLIAVADHGNSGLTMGNRQTNDSYAKTPAERFVGPLKEAELTVTGALSQLKDDRSNLKKVLESYGLKGLSRKQIKRLKKADDLEQEMVQLMAKKAKLGFTTRGHSGEDVFLYAFGPNKPAGLINNTDLAKFVVEHLDLAPLPELTKKRFVRAKELYESFGYSTKVEKRANGQAVFIANKNGQTIEYPANQNVKIINGKKEELEGIVVFNGHSFWIPKQ